MFVKSYTSLPVDYDELREALIRCALSWLSPIAQEAERYGEQLLVDVGLQARGALPRPAGLEVGEAMSTERTTSLALRLQVQGAMRLLPSLEGSLDAAWLGAGRTHLALTVRYEAVDRLGHTIDRVLLHRVVEAMALRLLELIAEHLGTCDSE